MAIIFRRGAFAVEAVIVNCRTVFRVCRYRGIESTVLDTFEGRGVHDSIECAIKRCKLRAKMTEEV